MPLLIVVALIISACSQTMSERKNVDLEKLATSAFEAEDFVSSRAYYEQVLQLRPTISAYIGLANSFEALEEWSHASEIWLAVSRIETLEPLTQGLYITNASKNVLRSSDPNRAQKLMQMLTKEQSDQRNAHSVNGLISVYNGDKDSAIAHFQKILDKDSNDQPALTNLGLSYLIFDEPSKALEILKKLSNDEASKLNQAIAFAYIGKENDAFLLLNEIQTEEEAIQTISFARHLKDQSSQSKVEMLFGITSKQ